MSGPKSYSVQVFDKNLKSLFLLQSEIISLLDTLKSKVVSDKSGKFEITGDDLINKNINHIEDFSRPVHAMLEGELNQSQFDAFYIKIHTHLEKQAELKKILQDQIALLDGIEIALTFYQETESMLAKYREDFDFLKEQMLALIKKTEGTTSDKKEKTDQILHLHFDFSLPDFSPETAKNVERDRSLMIKSFDEACKKLGEAAGAKTQRGDAANSISGVRLVSADAPDANNEVSPKDFSGHIHAIEKLIPEVKPEGQKQIFEERLLNLRRYSGSKEPYFFIELHEDIKTHIRRQELKSGLLKIERELSSMTFISVMDSDIHAFKKQLALVLQRDVIKAQDISEIRSRFAELAQKNRLLKQEQLMAERERKYIKSRLAAALKSLNYDVAGETAIIDFENDEALLLQIPDQENFINLRFDESGRMLYNFLIPEDRDELSHDQKVRKMAEMEESCDAFKAMLGDLKDQGLDIVLKNEIPITEKALVRLPAKYRAGINISAHKKLSNGKSQARLRKLKK